MGHKTRQRDEMKDKLNEDNLKDSSMYGEFVSTFHHWVSSEDLHAQGEHLQHLGNSTK